MDFIPYETIKFYPECASLVEGLGFKLVELNISHGKDVTKISVVISSKSPETSISVDDCAKVHVTLLPRLEALLGTDNTSMELTSPGIERNIKNAAEFTIFTGWNVRVFDKTITEWTAGKIKSANENAVDLEKEDGQIITVLYENIAKAKFLHE